MKVRMTVSHCGVEGNLLSGQTYHVGEDLGKLLLENKLAEVVGFEPQRNQVSHPAIMKLENPNDQKTS